MKTTNILIAIALFVITVSTQHSLVAQESQQVTKQKFTEAGAKEIAKHITDIYSNLVLKTTSAYLNNYRNVTDTDLAKLFELCYESIISTTNKFGWKKAKIVYLSNNTNYIIDRDNLPSKDIIAEKSVVNKLRRGNKIALETEGNTFTVGVPFFDQTQTKRITIIGCIECHEKILKNQNRFKGTNLRIEVEHIDGAIIYQIPSKG